MVWVLHWVGHVHNLWSISSSLYFHTSRVLTDHHRAACCYMYGWSLLLSALYRGSCYKIKNNKGYVGTQVASLAPTMYIVCIWHVGPLCSQHWSTSLPGHSMQHDPSSNQPVIDPVVLLWIPMAHQLYMYMWVCVCLLHLPLAGLLAACPTLLTSALHSECIQRP